MRILIAGSIIANEGYEEEQLVKALEKELKNKHTVDTFLLPFTRNFITLPDQILAYQLLDVSDCDMLITIGYPACMLEHKNKVCYLFDSAPHFWEYWDSQYGVLCNNQYLNIRNTILEIEKKLLSSAKSIVCNSKLLSQDLNGRLNIMADTLYCPALNINGSENNPDEKYILTETCLLPYQRPELLIEAAKQLNEFKLKVYIPSADAVYIETFEKWIENNGLNKKIEIIYNPAGIKDYEKAAAYITTDYNVRRISNSLIKAVNAGVPVLFSKDCGAELEVIENYSPTYGFDDAGIGSVNDKIINSLKRPTRRGGKSNEISFFAERLAGL